MEIRAMDYSVRKSVGCHYCLENEIENANQIMDDKYILGYLN